MSKREATPSPGDTARTLALLWGNHTKPGRSGLTVAAIVRAAMEIADAAGLEAVGMRQVAERLNVGTMSLYTHVPSKAELIALMADIAYGELYDDASEPVRQPGGWRGGMTFVARRNWELYARHPWLMEITEARPMIGPHASLKYEAELGPLEGIGLDDVEIDSTLTLILSHVANAASMRINHLAAQQQSGQSDAEWWHEMSPLLDHVFQGRHFPLSARIGEASSVAYDGVLDPDHVLTFGLERILDGVEVLITRRLAERESAADAASDGR